jgi:hypothetical protein
MVTSIIISAASSGFSVALVSYDVDVDPLRRKKDPSYFGYVPDVPVKRLLVFVTTMVNSALLLLLRSFAAAMLILVGAKYLLWHTLIDVGLFFLYAIARNDFWYGPIVLDRGLGAITTHFICRFTSKIVTDYTALVHCRSPQELGGLYWTLNIVLAIVSSFGSVKLHFSMTPVDTTGDLVENTSYLFLTTLSVALVAGFGIFMTLIKAKYRRTFYSLTTAHEAVQARFLNGDTDQVKADIVKKNRHCWEPIRPQVVEFFHANWDKWKQEHPDWFTENFVAKVDDDLIPAAALRDLKVQSGGQRRRTSLGDLVARQGGGVGGRSVAVVPTIDDDADDSRSERSRSSGSEDV